MPENEKYYDKYPQKIIKTPDSVTKRTFFYVLEAGRAETNSDLKSISNYNNAFLIGVVTEGKCRLTINGKSFNLNDEECFFNFVLSQSYFFFTQNSFKYHGRYKFYVF